MEMISPEMAEIAEESLAQPLTLGKKVGAFMELTKPRIAVMLVLTSAAGFYLGSRVTAGAQFNWLLFLNAMIGITLLAFGVAALNQYWERDLDKLMERTAKRPLPVGKLNSGEALAFALALTVGAEIYLALGVNLLTAGLGLVVIVGYVLMYTPMKTRTPISTAVGAIPGAMPPLMGWTSAANGISTEALVLFWLLFIWQFPHFLAIANMYKEQYRAAGIRMLPVVEKEGKNTAFQIVFFSVMIIPVSVIPYFTGLAGIVYFIGAIALGLWFLYASVKAAREKTTEASRKLLMTSVMYLPLIFFLMVINSK
jgi:protoheme IX farnesyltransferase